MRGDPRSTPDDLAVAMWPIAASSSARDHTGDYLRGGHSEPICARFLSCHNFLSQPVSQTCRRETFPGRPESFLEQSQESFHCSVNILVLAKHQT